MAGARPLTVAVTASLALHALVLTVRFPAPSAPYILSAAPASIEARLADPAAPIQPVARKPPRVSAAAPADVTSVAQFRHVFIGSAARYLDHLPAALEGEVLVSVSFRRGRTAEVRVKRSSGHDVLDRQALDLLRSAAAAMAVPGALRGEDFAFDVPVVYALNR